LDSKGERVNVLTKKHEFLFSPPPLPHGSPESHEFPVYPVSNSQELEKELEELGKVNACVARHTARIKRWKLVRDLIAVEKRISRKLRPDELMKTFDKWHRNSLPQLDPKKRHAMITSACFFAELGKVRVPTGKGQALQTALARISAVSLHELPAFPDAPESWRKVAARHRELARQSGVIPGEAVAVAIFLPRSKRFSLLPK
jgi:hypothetical protein